MCTVYTLVFVTGLDSETPRGFQEFLNISLTSSSSGSSVDRVLYLTQPGTGYERRSDVTLLPSIELFQESGYFRTQSNEEIRLLLEFKTE